MLGAGVVGVLGGMQMDSASREFQLGLQQGRSRHVVAAAVIDRGSVAVALRLLRATVVEPWESVDQVVAEHGAAELGDPLTESTGAWHLRHIVEIFRVHGRVVLDGLGGSGASGLIARPEDPVPLEGKWDVRAVRDELLADVDRLGGWLMEQEAETLARPLVYGRPTDLTTMLSVMLQHIVFHAAAVHYWVKWKGRETGVRAG